MSKFVMECPGCGRYVEVRKGFFAKKEINCACGYVISVKTEKLTNRTCPHCGNSVVFDQSKGKNAKCPVCKNPINTMAEQNKTAEFSCAQCGIKLMTSISAQYHTCPVCDCVNDVSARIASEKIKQDGLASVIKYEGDADTLIWKHPIEDFNMGSQLIVHETQEAILFRDGMALDLFGAGRYTLETQKLPILDKVYHLPTDTNGTFHSEVYFINTAYHMAAKWGTRNKIRLIDPLTNAPMELGARGVFNFRVVNSRKLLMKLVGTTSGLTREDFIGDGNSHIKDYFRSVLQVEISTHIADVITEEKIDILQLDQQKKNISTALLPKVQPYFSEFGVEITEILVAGFVLPQEGELGYESLQRIIFMREANLNKQYIQTETEIELANISKEGQKDVLITQYELQRKVAEATGDTEAERIRMQLEMDRKLQMAQIEAEEMRLKGFNQKDVLQAEVQKAYAEGIGNMGPAIGGSNAGSVIGDVLSMSVGMAAVSSIVPQFKDMVSGMNVDRLNPNKAEEQPVTSTKPTVNVSAIADAWDCSVCNSKQITSNFCPECGAKRPVQSNGWDCPVCGNRQIKSKFCPECGTKKPDLAVIWNCPDCGSKDIKGNFCPDCGLKRPV